MTAPDPSSVPGVRRAGLGDLMRLAAPAMLARIGAMTMGLTNTVVVGRHSAEQLGFHALGWAPTGVVVVMSVGLLTGVQVMTSRALGEGRPERAGAVLRRGLSYALWVGLSLSVVLFFFGPVFLRALGLSPALAAGAGAVVQVFAIGLPFELLSRAAGSFLEGLSRPAPVMIATWSANLVNLVLNLVLVSGAWGLEPMGAVGAAWATGAARLALVLLLMAYIARMPDARALGVFARPERDLPAEREQRRIGYGAGASLFVETAAFSGMNVVAGWIGATAVAGWAVVNNVAALAFMAPLGLSAATSVLVARANGAPATHTKVRVGKMGFAVCTAISGAVALVVWPLAPVITRLYATDPELIAMASAAMKLACLFLVADALQVVAGMALRARGDVWTPTATHVLSYAGVMLPLGWWLAIRAGLGLNGIVIAIIVASLLSAGLLLGRFWMLARQRL